LRAKFEYGFKHVLYYRLEEDLAAVTALRTGPLSLVYENSDLLYI
jgi:hypothetical protein